MLLTNPWENSTVQSKLENGCWKPEPQGLPWPQHALGLSLPGKARKLQDAEAIFRVHAAASSTGLDLSLLAEFTVGKAF